MSLVVAESVSFATLLSDLDGFGPYIDAQKAAGLDVSTSLTSQATSMCARIKDAPARPLSESTKLLRSVQNGPWTAPLKKLLSEAVAAILLQQNVEVTTTPQRGFPDGRARLPLM